MRNKSNKQKIQFNKVKIHLKKISKLNCNRQRRKLNKLLRKYKSNNRR